ncbi:MAG: PLDc N-terminal domain-containing protein [Bacteroidales bacterium]|nr:PLDc N-terminal domain-containing protein [Bacteroidales bacterium]
MEIIALTILTVISLFLLIWAIIDIAKSRFIMQYGNTLWLFIVILFPIFGSMTYSLLKRKITTKEKRQFNPKFKDANL